MSTDNITLSPSTPHESAAPAPGPSAIFPTGFVWGAATAAFQIEGAAHADGKGESIWDRFSHTPGRVRNGHTGDIACCHYERYEEDIALMADIGLKAYRFSIAWPRIFPNGAGAINQAGVDFYRRLLAKLRDRDILPVATLYHWDLPQALQNRGGWANRDTAQRFAEYADAMFRLLGDEVHMWSTLNEPAIVAYMGHLSGIKAPGTRRFWEFLNVVHHLMLGHGLAVQAFRQSGTPSEIGIVLNPLPSHPGTPHPRDVRASQGLDLLWNRLFYEPLFRGHYPPDALRFFRRRGIRMWTQPGDLELISQPLDYVGLNVYTRALTRSAPVIGMRPMSTTGPTTAMGWEIYPPCVYEVLQMTKSYTDLPLYIAENGAAFNDTVGPDGQVNDPERIAYLHAHMAEARRAIEDGVDLRGYFVWSLLDNFEWEDGYSKRFGLIHIDYGTLKRTPKRSAFWFRDVIARNGLAPLDGG